MDDEPAASPERDETERAAAEGETFETGGCLAARAIGALYTVPIGMISDGTRGC